MVLNKKKYLCCAMLIAILINLFGCREAMSVVIESEELEIKWNESINNSSESWWYAGNKNSHNYIVIKRSYSSKTYQVDEDKTEIIGIQKFDFTKNEEQWVNIKIDNIRFVDANK